MERPFCLQAGACMAKGSGHCRTCALKSPTRRAKVSAAMQRVLADPEKLARRREQLRIASQAPGRLEAIAAARSAPGAAEAHRANCKAAMRKRLADPVKREALRQAGLTIGNTNLRAGRDALSYQRGGEAIRALHLSWCPPEHWPLNATLKRKGYGLPDRKRMILEIVEGSAEHAKRVVENAAVAGRLKHERDLAQRY